MNKNTQRPFLPETLFEWVFLIPLLIFVALIIASIFVGAPSNYDVHKKLERRLIQQEKRIQKIEAGNRARDADLEWILKSIPRTKPNTGEQR